MQANPGSETERVCPSGGEFELTPSTPMPAQAPRGHVGGHSDDDEVPVEEDDVDREAHADRVDAPQRVREQQSLVRTDPVPPQQAQGRRRAERASDHHALDQHATARCLRDLDHGASVPSPAAYGRCARSTHALRTRTDRRSAVAHPNPPIPLRYAPRMLCEDFHSGDDVTLGFLGRTYSFARRDFEQRVARAGVELGLAARPVSRGERDDLVAGAIAGTVADARSEVGERIAELQARGGEDPVYWLRKLVFRSAWLDHRIKHGQIDVAFDDSVGAFRIEPGRYPLPGSGHPSFAASEASA